MLCRICENIQYDDLDQERNDTGYPGHPHHRNFAELQSCLDCDFCRVVTTDIAVNEVLKVESQWQEQRIYLRVIPSSTAIDESDKSNLLVYCSPWQENGRDQTTLAFYGIFVEKTQTEMRQLKPDPGHPAGTLISGRPTSALSDSEECFQLANCWLDQCVNYNRSNACPDQHSHPFPHVDAALLQTLGPSKSVDFVSIQIPTRKFMPSRTIDVGSTDGSQEPRLVCHTAKGRDVVREWVTLSHRWGGNTPLKTTLSTFSQWQESIPLIKMPSTFRDAVNITRKLGIRHLWIDALCIIQDSPEDWKFEIERMGDVYKHGLLNIAANNARTCHDGIFSKRADSLAPARLPLRSEKRGIISYMYVRSGRWDIYTDGLFSKSTLSSRGWVLQESLLSPRTLHYTKKQMLWECLHCTLSESSILPMAINTVSDRIAIRNWVSNKLLLTGIAQQSLDQVVVENDLDKRVNLYNVWLQIISNYTERKLTFQSDILAAVAGAASILQAYLGDRYLAGLFEGDLLRSLLWRVTDPSVASSSSYGAPSWSWASLVGAVRPEVGVDSNLITPRIVGDLTARVISAETYSSGILTAPINHFLDVSGGQLQLDGYLLRGKSLANLRYKIENSDLIKKDHVDPSRAYAQQPSLYLDLSGDLDEPHDVAILHIGVWEWRFEHKNIPTRIETKSAGLILRMIDSTRSQYRRIGIAAMRIGNLNVEQSCRFQEEAESLITSEWMKTVVTIT